MKKLLSLLISVIMVLGVIAPVSATVANAADEIVPIIYVRGNGQEIVDADGNEVICDIGDIGKIDLDIDSEDEDSKNKIVEAAANIILPFLTEGLLLDEWDSYEKAIYDELSPLFEKAMLDGDGNPQYGTDIAQMLKDYNADIKNKGNSFYSYGFYFDWRLSPYDNVDKLHAYIEAVMSETGATQVSLTSRCLGGSLINAYLEVKSREEGGLDHIKNVLYCDTLSNGCTMISKGFSGKLEFDSKSIQMYEAQLGYLDEVGYGSGLNISGLAGEIVEKSLDLFSQVGVVDKFAGGLEKLYSRLYQALIPALFKSVGYVSQPIYWTFVKEEDFDDALEVMFGEEGSEEWKANEGLISKILEYRTNISSRHDEFLLDMSEKLHIGVIAKYGLMSAPLIEGYDKLSDNLASLEDSSMGATCSTIGKTLTDDYIQDRVNKGYEDYISADKQVDTSTCLFPETTWIVKNVHHDDFDRSCKALAEKFLKGTKVIVETSGYSRFRINDYETNTVSDMTADNCADIDCFSIVEENPTTETRLVSLMKFLTVIINFITKLFSGEFDFSNLFA